MKTKSRKTNSSIFAKTVGAALRRSAKAAQKTARLHGTSLYYWKNGKVVAEKP